jgi:hypothetical protein
MAQKSLLILFIIFFATSALFLFWQNDRELDPDQGKNWWTLSLTSPEQEASLGFVIENHSNQTNFQYEIFVGRDMILQDTLVAKSGEKTSVTPPSIAKQTERVKITVTAGNEKKEIYR